MDVRELAERLDNFMRYFDPYEYADSEMNVDEAEKLITESPETVISNLLEILEELG